MSGTPTVGEVKQFVEELREPEKLLEGCRRFHELEPRDIAYVVCSNLVSKSPSDMSYVLPGTRIFLQLWNAVYIQHKSRQIKQTMEEDIRGAYMSCASELGSLAGYRLDTVALDQPATAGTVKRVFQSFAQYESIGDTGASKIMHLLNPSLFMMWDTKIREAYATLLPDQLWVQVFETFPNQSKNMLAQLPRFQRKQLIQRSMPFRNESYLLFMKACQLIAQGLLSREGESQLWARHAAFAKDSSFIHAWGFSETPAKMIDECNFVRWKLGEPF